MSHNPFTRHTSEGVAAFAEWAPAAQSVVYIGLYGVLPIKSLYTRVMHSWLSLARVPPDGNFYLQLCIRITNTKSKHAGPE